MGDKKILIAYGTRYGSARIAAQDISSYMEEKGFDVDIINLKKENGPKDLTVYDLVIAGSSVAMFSWVGKVKSFLKKCRKDEIYPVVFITCGTCIDKEQEAKERFLDKVTNRLGITPVLCQVIEPVIDFRPELGIDPAVKNRIKATIKGMAGDKYQEDGLMDFRDKKRFNGFLESLGSIVS